MVVVFKDIWHLKQLCWDFPGGPVVKTSPSSTGSVGLIPGQDPEIPCDLWSEYQNIKPKQYCNQFNKDFKNGPH